MSKKQPLNPETMTPLQVCDMIGKLMADAGRSYGMSQDDMWEWWLGYATTALETGLRPFREGKPLDMTPILENEEELRRRFDASFGRFDVLLDSFREAFTVWYTFSSCNVYDVLGETYMRHMLPNSAAGQVFTPWNVTLMMAQMTIGTPEDAARLVFNRIREAVERLREADPIQAILADSILLTALIAVEGEGSLRPFQSLFLRLMPLIAPFYEPITIHDPACGSGNMMLAAASCFPLFAVRFGLVQFFGQDISHDCVLMARLNEMAYGLNGWGAAAIVADMIEEEGEGLPPALPEPTAAEDLLPEDGRGEGRHIFQENSLLVAAQPQPEEPEPTAVVVLSPVGKSITLKDGAEQFGFAFLFEEEGASTR